MQISKRRHHHHHRRRRFHETDKTTAAHGEAAAEPRRSFRVSLRYKLAVPVFVLVFSSFAFVLYTTLNTVRDMMTSYKEARLQTIAEVFAETLRIPMSEGDKKTLKAYISLLAEQTDVEEVRVENPDGEVVGNSNPSARSGERFSCKPDFFGVRRTGRDTYAAVAPVTQGDEILGRLIITFTRIDIENELRKLFAERFMIATVLAILATLIVSGITWLTIRPLFTLQRTARRILAGDLDARAKIRSRDEIQEVGDAFNKVVSRLVQSFEHLRLRTQALEASEEKYRSIVNEVSDIIFSITPEGELLLLNRGFSGYTREEILAGGLQLLLSMHAPEDAQKFQEALELIVSVHQPIFHLNTRHIHRTHRVDIYYQTSMTPVIDYEGNLRMIQGVMRDVTEIRRVEMMKETLIRDVAHELKTPTAKFIMTTQWLERQMTRSPDGQKFLPTVKTLSENADRLMKTISSIMDLSKIESGMVDVQKQEVNLNDILNLVVNDTRPLAAQHHLTIQTEFAPEPLAMLGDPDMLYRLFVNLVSNAIKFTPDGGSITVTSYRKGQAVCADVRDTGIGIEHDHLEKIFEAFYQRTPSSLGIGVGLTISKELVLLHEGDMWAESDGLGKGMVMKTVFPMFRGAT
ncbi:MAG: Sensor histidine kinase YycG [Candidatus Omnitrophica bacterium ADurb.Bin314]|jgi:two-component system phosphate regulon sensor histidine kinase PhoR|nr:MAG: Sensor histidine kinase YycG [Candidatus Omnitrophica bacterium ADurb.Bin314]HOE68162.1 PAS domain-containing sensor histidine kinase [Candidatus Omnitrophota bacterium]HPW65014.1 PAS domain-containing sensor histidine kinase [Candidatus Omnitrophota bacterium]